MEELNVDKLIRQLNELLDEPEKLVGLPQEKRKALFQAAGRLSRPEREDSRKRSRVKRKLRRREKTAADRKARAQTGIRQARMDAVFSAPEKVLPAEAQADGELLSSPRNCYVCKEKFDRLHFFYDSMCKTCGDFNYAKRFQTADLTGQVGLITGARLKIGYQAALMMLRAGARVIATTRFPVDAAIRYAAEKDSNEWLHRLHVYGLDLRHTPSVEIFAGYILNNYERLDLLVNNAAQTVRRPSGFYAHLMEKERLSRSAFSQEVQTLLSGHERCKGALLGIAAPSDVAGENLPVAWNAESPGVGIRASAELSQIPYAYDRNLAAEEVFPVGQLDADLQQVDLRKTNSWRLRLGEVPTVEMLEIQLVNAVAPFVLCNRLVSLMRRDNTGKKHIVNVTAMEGKFHRFKKIDRHPHTNMAKAALNMMTHTSASDFAKDGIYMNAVDTGWVTDEDPMELAKAKEETHDFQPQLDIVDGAARVCDPFFDGINTGTHWCGKFLKDYRPIDW